MISVWKDYESRVEEIENYFSFLINEIDKGVDTNLIKVLKANGFLILYNLLESTVRNAIEEIHTSINSESLKYGELIPQIKAIWIEYHYKKFEQKSSTTITTKIDNIATDTFKVPYQDYIKKVKSNDLSGNLDRRKVDNLAEKYGFDKNVNSIGSELHTVKKVRNSLAHGNQSFSEVGRSHTKQDMEHFKEACISYLEELLKTIEGFNSEKKYKNAPNQSLKYPQSL